MELADYKIQKAEVILVVSCIERLTTFYFH